jgi:hypothetical protein
MLVTALFALLALGVLPGLVGVYSAAANAHSAEGPARVALSFLLVHSLLVASVLCGVLAVELLLATRWAVEQGLDARDRHRLFLDERTAGSSFWARPHILPLMVRTVDADPRTPPEHVSALQALAERLDGGRRVLAEEALVTARLLAGEIRNVDDAVARLSSAGDAASLAKLEAQRDAAGETGELRELLSRQLEATRAVAARLDDARERRRRLGELLSRLWAEVRSLESSSDVSQRLRSACAEIRREAGRPDEPTHSSADVPTL